MKDQKDPMPKPTLTLHLDRGELGQCELCGRHLAEVGDRRDMDIFFRSTTIEILERALAGGRWRRCSDAAMPVGPRKPIVAVPDAPPAVDLRTQLFPDGDLYSCREDDEELTHTDASDALESYLDQFVEKVGETVAQTMAREFPDGLTLYVFKRNVIDDKEIEAAALWLIESLAERWDENDEFGGPDHSVLDNPNATTAKVLPPMLAAVRQVASVAEVWACTQSAKVDLTVDQVVAILEEKPG